jgi:hypothetical protein
MTIIQQNVNQTHKEIAERPKSMKPHKEISCHFITAKTTNLIRKLRHGSHNKSEIN